MTLKQPPMLLVDTHCHIQDALTPIGEGDMFEIWQHADRPKPDDMLTFAKEHHVSKFICVGTTVEDSKLAVEFAVTRMDCWASIGIHPHEIGRSSQTIALLRSLLMDNHSKIIAIGECGLDYHYNYSDRDSQIKMLRAQIELALEFHIPLIFHVREAFDDFWPVFDSYSDLHGVLHSYTDTQENLAKALERGLYIGQNGIVTFTKDTGQLAVAQAVPLESLLLETDAPFLTPVPLRGKINEPANIRRIAEFFSELRHESLESIAHATTSNAQHLFALT